MWWKFQCDARTNPKFAIAGPIASWVWACANSWSREQLTDGKIPKMMLPALVPGMTGKQVKAAAEKLIAAKLAHDNDDGGFTIHDFLMYHPSKEKVKADREADSVRKRPLFTDDSERKDHQIDKVSEVPCTRTGDSDSGNSSALIVSKSHPIKDLLTLHEKLFTEANNGEKPAKYTAADAKHAKDLIERHGEPKAQAIVYQAFRSTDKFVAGSGRSMGVIISSGVQNRLISELSGSVSAGDGFDGLREFVKHG